MNKRSVWRDVSDDTVYVPRCSVCGKWKTALKAHWFFTGVYCVGCIQDILYDDARTLSEVQK